MKQATLLSLMAFSLVGCKNLTNTTQPLTTPSTDSSTSELKTVGNQIMEVDGKYQVLTKKAGDFVGYEDSLPNKCRSHVLKKVDTGHFKAGKNSSVFINP